MGGVNGLTNGGANDGVHEDVNDRNKRIDIYSLLLGGQPIL